MCGRITRTSPREAIAKEFGVTQFAEVDWHPRYNVAPSQLVETIISVYGERRLGPMRWGFVSPTAKEPKLAPVNARAETLPTSPMFRDAFRSHRCLVVAGWLLRVAEGRAHEDAVVRVDSIQMTLQVWRDLVPEPQRTREPLCDLRAHDSSTERTQGNDHNHMPVMLLRAPGKSSPFNSSVGERWHLFL